MMTFQGFVGGGLLPGLDCAELENHELGLRDDRRPPQRANETGVMDFARPVGA